MGISLLLGYGRIVCCVVSMLRLSLIVVCSPLHWIKSVQLVEFIVIQECFPKKKGYLDSSVMLLLRRWDISSMGEPGWLWFAGFYLCWQMHSSSNRHTGCVVMGGHAGCEEPALRDEPDGLSP